jgi:hypothetical protein
VAKAFSTNEMLIDDSSIAAGDHADKYVSRSGKISEMYGDSWALLTERIVDKAFRATRTSYPDLIEKMIEGITSCTDTMVSGAEQIIDKAQQSNSSLK